jgi:hypothetical protein
VKCDALYHQPAAGAGKLRGSVSLAHLLQFGKERPQLRKCSQEAFKLFAKADNGHRSGLVAAEADDSALPVNVLGGE